MKQQKFLQAKFGGVEDEMHEDDEDEDEEGQKALWGGMKNRYYYGDNRDIEVRALFLTVLSSFSPLFAYAWNGSAHLFGNFDY